MNTPELYQKFGIDAWLYQILLYNIKARQVARKRRYLVENKDSFDAELWAISDAVEIGIKKTRNGSPTTVTVFTDSQTAIAKILKPKVRSGGDAVRDLIYQNADTIKDSGHTSVLRWIPSHSKVLGNDKADAAAKGVEAESLLGRQTSRPVGILG